LIIPLCILHNTCVVPGPKNGSHRNIAYFPLIFKTILYFFSHLTRFFFFALVKSCF